MGALLIQRVRSLQDPREAWLQARVARARAAPTWMRGCPLTTFPQLLVGGPGVQPGSCTLQRDSFKSLVLEIEDKVGVLGSADLGVSERLSRTEPLAQLPGQWNRGRHLVSRAQWLRREEHCWEVTLRSTVSCKRVAISADQNETFSK